MAKVTQPLGSTEARGRFGGLIANTWRGISSMKSSSSPAQPRSALQLKIRARSTMLVRYWGTTLSAPERTLWNEYASGHPEIDWTGNSKRLSGLNWFVRCNIRLLSLAQAIIESPPVVAAPDALVDFAASDGVLSSALTWDATAGTDLSVEIRHLGVISAGIQPKIERAKQLTLVTGESGATSANNLQAGRHWFWARVISEVTGLASPWVLDSADVTAA